MINLIFMGTPDFSVPALKSLINCKDINVLAVVTNHDKPVGRKQILSPSPVKVCGVENNIKVLQYDKIRLEGYEDIKALSPDIIVTCAFGQILSQEILDIPRFGVINIHASLLPKYRGASPIHFAIQNGEKQTGITIMKTEYEVDSGDIICQESIDILDKETTGELFERLSILGANMIVEAVKNVVSGNVNYIKQDHEKATFTKMIKKDMAKIDWNKDANFIYNQIRAFNPSPIAFTFLGGEMLKIYSAKIGDKKGACGEVISFKDNLEIACKNGSIIVEEVQKAGGKRMNIKDFLRGSKILEGTILTNG